MIHGDVGIPILSFVSWTVDRLCENCIKWSSLSTWKFPPPAGWDIRDTVFPQQNRYLSHCVTHNACFAYEWVPICKLLQEIMIMCDAVYTLLSVPCSCETSRLDCIPVIQSDKHCHAWGYTSRAWHLDLGLFMLWVVRSKCIALFHCMSHPVLFRETLLLLWNVNLRKLDPWEALCCRMPQAWTAVAQKLRLSCEGSSVFSLHGRGTSFAVRKELV